MPGQLDVYLFEHHVGQLAQVNGRLNFSYTPNWLAHSGARTLSHSLPLQVSRQNDFGLLDGIGGESAHYRLKT